MIPRIPTIADFLAVDAGEPADVKTLFVKLGPFGDPDPRMGITPDPGAERHEWRKVAVAPREPEPVFDPSRCECSVTRPPCYYCSGGACE
jgi:hypothetical protein